MRTVADLLSRLYNAFNPLHAATPAEYVDTAAARGSADLTPYFVRHLRRIGDGDYLNFIFSGHIGGGKSSELVHLAHCIRHDGMRPGGDRFFAITLDILDYVDVYDVAPMDVMLGIVAEIGDALRNDPELKVELRDSLVSKRLRELWELLNQEVQLEGGEITIGSAKLKLKFLKDDRNRRNEVRRALDLVPAQVKAEINSVLDEARIAVRQHGFRDIVLIVDSLDRIERTPLHPEKLAAHRFLFLDNASLWADLHAHKVLTMPLSLVRAHGQQLSMRYGTPPFVLPLVKAETRGHARYESGYDVFRKFVERRLAGLVPWEGFMTEEAFEYLVHYSGGHPRLFTRFVMEALAEVDTLPIRREEARRAVRPTISNLIPSVHGDWWPKLAALELEPKQQVDEEDPDVQRMLDESMILEYRNGLQEATDVEDNAPWYAVHPILRETGSFKAEVDRRKGNDGSAA
jgi:hypothetical protein